MAWNQYLDQSLALLLKHINADNEPDWVVSSGIVSQDLTRIVLLRSADGKPFPLMEEWESRVKPVADDSEVKAILNGADWVLTLTIGTLPGEADGSDYLPTGMNWPQ